ncbi:hypothetical protein JD276_13180 [Leucobacter sp. CSA1]|uniref:Uncharacterized protein n=1 Tax=Leucobacter chromiisoli TaxID=2796471 RepID=A0A934Q843_9MICO|nr:hypothetical protein [Leucobacter chromiisoli]MBK0419984.1 hypothetical protein [Leucobacter chromiisoli]
MIDDLAMFLATRDPEKVSREWTGARLEDALLERPTDSMPRRPSRRQFKPKSFQQARAERMLAEITARKEAA